MNTSARYKGARCTSGRTSDKYLCIHEERLVQFSEDPAGMMKVRSTNVDLNQIFTYPYTQYALNYFLDSSLTPFAYQAFLKYKFFRIRSMTLHIQPQFSKLSDTHRTDGFIYWIPNHNEYVKDVSAGDSFTSWTECAESNYMTRIPSASTRPFSINFVPQVTCMDEVVYQSSSSVTIPMYTDKPMPFMPCETSILADLFVRTPVFYLRRPYSASASLPDDQKEDSMINVDHDGFTSFYQVTLSYDIEFRQLDDDN